MHDIIIDHCSAGLGHDEQLSISTFRRGNVSRVTLSNNIISFGLCCATAPTAECPNHNYGTLIDSGDNSTYKVDGVLVDGNLFSQVSLRTPLIGHGAQRVTVTNNITYNTGWNGMQVGSAQYSRGQFIDAMNNLYWRGARTENAGTWPTDDPDWSGSSCPTNPPWRWSTSRRPIFMIGGPSGGNTHVYFSGNFDYVNGDDYTCGDHHGRPVLLEQQRYQSGITFSDVNATSRVTDVDVQLMNPAELEAARVEFGRLHACASRPGRHIGGERRLRPHRRLSRLRQRHQQSRRFGLHLRQQHSKPEHASAAIRPATRSATRTATGSATSKSGSTGCGRCRSSRERC